MDRIFPVDSDDVERRVDMAYGSDASDDSRRSTRRGGYLEKMFCKHFSESSLCLPRQQGSCTTTAELSENF